MPMKEPAHPGRIVRSACLEPLGLSISEGAKILGVSRQALNNVISGRSGISPEMAIRLTKAFGSTEETWLRMQLAWDLAAARKSGNKIKLRRQHVEDRPLRLFDAFGAYRDRKAQPVGHGAQEFRLFPGRFEERHRHSALQQNRQHQAGKPCPAAKIGQRLGFVRDQGRQLGAVPDMPLPDLVQ